MTDSINIRNLCLYASHGVLSEEKTLGQKFYIDADCVLDLSAAGQSDDMEQSVCYGELCTLITAVSHQNSFHLIEALAENIAGNILGRYPMITSVTIAVRKPSAPINAVFDHVGVTITRTRQDQQSP